MTPILFNDDAQLSIIYLPRVLCLSFVLSYSFLSSCHNCGTLSYSLCFSNQTDQGDKMEGLEREGLRWRDRKGTDCRGRVWKDFSWFKHNLINMNVHSATCSCSIELYKVCYTLADFLPNCDISRGFLYVCIFLSLVGSVQLWWQGTLYF